MSTPAQKDSERSSSRQRGSSECKTLIDAATKDLFRKNAFRITGLSVDATTREIARHADKLKMLSELGQDPHTLTAAFPMKPPPILDEIREAIQKLKEPEKRMVDEFFWFWPEEFGDTQSDPAMQALAKGDSKTAIEIWAARENSNVSSATAKHNLAVVYHVSALDWENYAVKNTVETDRREKITNYWKGAFNRWEKLGTNEQFWEQVAARIRQLNEPNLPTGFARRMRATLPEALDKINAELAVEFAESGKIELARLHIQFIRETNQGLGNVEKAAELVLTPARNRLKEQIQRARESAQQNPTTAHEAARALIEHARPLLDVFDLFFGEQEHFQKEPFDEAATTVVNCLVAYQRKTGDNETFVKLLEQTLPLAESVEVRRRIEENIGIGKGNLNLDKFAPLYAQLKSLQDGKELPRAKLEKFNRDLVNTLNGAVANVERTSDERKELFNSAAIVLRVISLDAWNKHQDRATAVAANGLALKFASDAELKRKLHEDESTLTQFSNPFGDAGGEHTRMERGSYDGGMYVLFAVIAEIVCAGILSLSFITNILKIPCDETTSWIVGGLAGLGVALLVFWNRWKCVEAFSSQFCSGVANLSLLYVPVVAFTYANWRGIKKVFDRREWEDNGANKSSRLALVATAIVLILGIVGFRDEDKAASTSTTHTPPASSAPAYTPPPVAPTAPAYTPPTFGNGNSGENVSRVPSSVSSTLASEKAEIESERTTLEALETQIENLGREIERDRIYLDRTSQVALDSFNEKVDRYNALSQKAKIANAAFNEKVDNYNAKLQQYGR